MLNALLVIGGCILYLGIAFLIAELCGINKIDDEH